MLRWSALILVSALATVLWPSSSFVAQSSDPCAGANSIRCENLLEGTPQNVWDVAGAGDLSIQGFATDISVNRGQTVQFKIDTDAAAYRLDIYRLGYYGGDGARLITSVNPSATLPQVQPECLEDTTTGLVDCGNWAVSASWAVPATAVSGIYFARAERLDTGGASHIFFVVRHDGGNSELLFQTSDTTWQAYNRYGGNSLYVGSPAGRAYKVSYNRPFTTRDYAPEDWVFNAEYPMVRWLEANGFDVSYTTGVDSDRLGAQLLGHRAFLSVGHDEYWSAGQRTNVEAARNAGVNLAFFSGNEVFWKTRWESSIAPGGAAYRTLVSYKETHANAKIDPLPNVWTGTWRDPRFRPPADGGYPENALTGTIFTVNSGTTSILVPAENGAHRFWRNTAAAGQGTGGILVLPYGTLGYEWDEDLDNGSRPAGLVRLSDTTVSSVERLQDYGSTYALGNANHAMTLYRHASGAYVFGAGTVQYSWGLDSVHDRGSEPASIVMQQATVNLFADMGAQPRSIQPGLSPATASNDTTPPTSAIASPLANSVVPAGTTFTISGVASDSGGGQVGAVEVSVDGGTTWRRANGRTAWTYSWQTGSPRTVNIRSRAIDDSGNAEEASLGVSVTVEAGVSPCPCSIWPATQNPGVGAENDPAAVELGVKFRSDLNGYITALRFYKNAQDVGPHIGNLWTAGGTLLASVPFAGEGASGWQEVALPSPIAITADTTYVASYHTASGRYTVSAGYFATTGVDNGPLHALRDGVDGANGLYRYGATGFPDQSFGSSNYWVDVVMATSIGPDTTPPSVLAVSPVNGATGVAASTAVTATFSENLTAASVSTATMELRGPGGAIVPALVSYTAGTRTAHLSPAASLAFTTTYSARLVGGPSGLRDAAGNPLAADLTWSFTTAAAPPPPPSEGPGGPILVVSSSGNPFSRYYAEILRAEGLNAFTATDISTVSAATLAGYQVIILGEMPLTAAQVTMFGDWVTAGGNLIAMRPDKQLAGLLGLADASATRTNAYLLVDTTVAPGRGIAAETLQYHGFADLYTLAGATPVATLFATDTTPTVNPAVTVRGVGPNGGQAAAFTFDLARSIVYTRQGNPAWSGQERDGAAPIRSNDFFFGGAEPDWVDLTKVAVPQADEQQRLLANLITFVNADRLPLPRFWYFPRGEKAVVVMTGDDHGNNGTAPRFDQYIAASPAACNVADWQCVRGTSYIYPSTPISDAQAAAYAAQGFEIAAHVTTGCADYTAASLASNYSDDLSAFAASFPSLPAPRTNRTHCIAFSDYDTQPQVALAHGVRLDTNYYYWPGSWVQGRPGFMTGSGMPMRFARLDGSIVDVYQAATQLTDESDQAWPSTIDALLDRALGAEGYYGFFVANMHTDVPASEGSDAIIASALARSVPVISAQQLLTWVDGRNASSFADMAWNGSVLTFSINVGSGANGLEAMIPAAVGNRTLTGLSRGGSPVAYRIEAIKGQSYAIFAAGAGVHEATFEIDATAPIIADVAATPAASSASVTWTTNEPATSRVDFGLAPSSLTSSAVGSGFTTQHGVTLTGLASGTTYYYNVTSADGASNSATAPVAPASFTTLTPPSLNCPCSVFPESSVPNVASENDSSAVELGMKFRSQADGFITALRFYKGPQNTGVHVGHLWTSAGVLLGSATYAGETPTGWQQVPLASPVAITANTTYVVSYHAPNGGYSSTGAQFAAAGVLNFPLEALASPASGGNGVYRYGSPGFPNQTFNGTNYWVDVVFATSIAPDVTAPVIVQRTPGTLPAALSAPITATFNEPMQAASVSGATFEIRNASGAIVPATVTYSTETRTASLQPSSPLAHSSSFTATVRGGAAGVRDTSGNAMAADYTWAFVSSTPAPESGPGGPVLVVTAPSNPFSNYYTEILRAEGLNAFTVADLSTVDAGTLGAHDVVILGEMPLSAAQVAMFTAWVNAGGNLIAMRPDKQLAGLLGLTDAAATLTEAYIQVQTAVEPGAGIVADTMKFHGTADLYDATSATTVATLFSTATAATQNPAVTVRSVGVAGGQAAAFAYDLARSVVLTRQGNPDWAGQERDGLTPIRSNDLFFGGTERDWVDLTKVAIPQADEQQRLLANLIGFMNRDRKPLPRFWYLPNGHRAAVVMTGDDHANNGTQPRFNQFMAASPSGCSVDDWTCVRATSYLYPTTPMDQGVAQAFEAGGFELGLHVTTGCGDYTPGSLPGTFSSELSAFAAAFPGLPSPRTNRTHCIVWSDYATQAEVSLANGIRLDTNYYYWPDTWVNDRPGLFTGSGFPMRFARANGSFVDVYQAATQMTDESGQSFPFTVDTLLDRALGPQGFYGTFVANIHTDVAIDPRATAIVASAQARGVPVISARQLLTWMDGRNASSFDGLSWDGYALSFAVTAASGSRGLQAMLPAVASSGPLTGIRRNGVSIPFSISTIKGVAYAAFAAETGAYVAEYVVDTAPPVVSSQTAAAGQVDAVVTWSTTEPASSRVDYGTAPDALNSSASAPGLAAQHGVTLTGLTGGTTYYYRAVSVDAAGMVGAGPVATFTTAQIPATFVVTDTTVADFTAGTASAGVRVTSVAEGEVELGAGVALDGGALTSGWLTEPWAAGGAVVSTAGQLVVDGAMARTEALYAPGRAVEFVATFGSTGFQHVGLAITFNEARWAIFSTGSGGALYARTHNGATATDTPIPGTWLNAPHRYRIEWGASTVTFSIDGTPVATHAVVISDQMRPVVSDFSVGGQSISVDWLELTPPVAASGTMTSRVLDAGQRVAWSQASWTGSTPAGTALSLEARFGDVAGPDGSWTTFAPIAASGATLSQTSRYVQYRATLSSDGNATPTLSDVTFVAGRVAPVVSVNDAVATEGQSGTTPATFTLTLPYAAAVEVRVDYAAVAGTASAGTDFISTSGTAIFAPGATSTSVVVDVIGDSLVEADETFRLVLSNPIGAGIGDGDGTATVLNDDQPALSVASGAVTETPGGTVANVVVSLASPTVQTVRVAFATSAGTASAGQDFSTLSGTLTLPGGVTSSTIAVPILDDPLDELDETLILTLSNPSGAVLGTAVATVTIVDDDPTPTITLVGPAVTETNAAQTATYTVTLSNPSSQSVTVDYATTNGTATAPADYTATSGTLTFATGVTSQTFSVAIAGDALDENDETFVVTLANPVAAVLGTAQVTTTIVDEDPTPTLTIADPAAVAEGNSGTVDAVFTVSLSAASGRSVTVNYATANGTAVASTDYTARSGTLTFAPGTTSQTIAVPVAGDTLDEPAETFVVNLTSPTGATLADGQGSVSITDNDPAVSIGIGNVAVTEGNSGTANASFPVTLSAASGFTVTVNYATAASSAGAPGDYTSQSGTLTFAPGVTTQNVVVPIVGDLANEATETFFVNLTTPGNSTIGDNQAVGTITDNDPPPTITVGDVSVTESNNNGSVTANFPVTLSAPSSFTVSVAYATAPGTAVASSDYTTRTGTVTFNPGVTSQTIQVPILGDTVNEPQESFVVNLSSASNGTIGDGQATATIADNDVVSLSIGNASLTEGNSGTQNLTFTVTKTGATVQTVTVNYATADGTAVQPADYSSRSGQLTFAPATTTQTIVVPVLGDTIDEIDEAFVVNLSAATVATISDNQATGTIADNDASPTLTVSGAALTEGNSGTSNLTFTATLSAISGRTVTVNYATANGTATAPADYTAASGTLTFNPGTTSQAIAVPVVGDLLDEVNETFVVNYSSASGATLNATQVTGTINDNDLTPSLSIADVAVAEGNSGTTNMTFVVSLSAVSGQAVTVNYATANGSASQPGDYSSRSGTLTIPAGSPSQTISVPIVGDTMDEPAETVIVNLSSVSASATIADSQATGTITDDDPTPTLAVNNVNVNESTLFNSTATFTVTLSNASSQQVTVNFATANGTATAGSDYTARTGTLTFAPGTTSQTVQVTVTGDFSDEPNETFFLNLSGATVATIADNQGIATIVDND